MRILTTIAVVALSLATAPCTPAFAANTMTDRLCGPNAPEGYKRPGGYCEQIGSNKSLSSDDDDEGCTDYVVLLSALKSREPLLVADTCIFVDGPENQ